MGNNPTHFVGPVCINLTRAVIKDKLIFLTESNWQCDTVQHWKWKFGVNFAFNFYNWIPFNDQKQKKAVYSYTSTKI